MASEFLEIKVGADVKGAINNFDQLKKALVTVGTGLGIAAAGFAGIALKAIALEPLINDLKQEFGELQQNIIDSVDPMRKYTAAISEISGAVIKNVSSVLQLVNALESGSLTVEQARLAQQKLVKEAPVFKDAFDKNGIAVKDLSDIFTNTYIPALINTIKTSAASEIITKKLKKSFDAIASSGETSALQSLINGFKSLGSGMLQTNFAANQAITKFKNFKEAQDALSNGNIQALLAQTYKDLGISVTNFGSALDNTGKPIKEHVKKLKEAIQEITKIGLGEETLYNRQILALEEKIKKQEEFNTLSKEILSNAPKRLPGTSLGIVDDPNAARGARLNIASTADLDALQAVNTQLVNMNDLINNGINGGIDTLFNALANNQDPFKALAQSAQRLVVELGAAVVKALLLKAISTALGVPGGDRAFSALGGLFKSTVRGDQLTQLAFLRG